MQKSAKTILNDCLNVKRDEKVLIIADSKTKKIGEGILNEARKITNASLKIIPVGKHDGEEPPKKIAEEMLFYDVVIAPTTTSLTHTKAVQDARKNARIATLPGITNEIMNGSLLADYNKIEKFTKEVFGRLKNSREIKVMTPTGSDFVFSVKDRNWHLDTGIIYYKARLMGNILNDEKVLGTCHVAFGNNSSIGGRVYSKLHLDTVLQKPTIVADGEILMKKGRFFL